MSFRRLAATLIAASLLALTGPSVAQTTPPPPPAQAPQPKPGDAFGEEVTLTAQTMIYGKGTANWDSAFETLVAALTDVDGALQKQWLFYAWASM